MPGLDIPPVDARVYALLAEAGFTGEPFNPRQHRSCELVERYVLDLVIDLLDGLELRPLLEEARTAEELVAARRFAPAFHRPLRWLLERLAQAAVVTREGARYRLRHDAPEPRLDGLRAAILESDASYAPTLALLDEARAAYPRVARGETTGERALFQKISLWPAYFSNRNAYYALNNRVAARAAAARLPRAGARVLEVGAGLGSATEALLEALRDQGAALPIAAYRLTEPVAFFRRRAERTLAGARPDLPLACAGLDIDGSWGEQGIEPASFELVWGVNVLHLARDLDATLRQAFDALAPGGWLVAGEGIRPVAGQPVGAEFPFQLLDAFVDVRTDPGTRPEPGFLTAEQWTAAFARAGFAPAELVPDVVRLRALHPGFFAAAVCGRRP